MTAARVPASVVLSLGVHGGALVLFGLLMHEAPKQAPKMVTGVDLLVEEAKPKPRAPGVRAPKPPPLSTMDFLKLALPTMPPPSAHVAAPEQLSVKIPDHKIALSDAPKLQDQAHKALPKLQALDLSAHPVDAAKLDVKLDQHKAAATLAAMPRLEDVGRKRIKNLPQALALEDSRREAVAAVGVPDLAIKAPSRHEALAAAAALKDAAPAALAPEPGLGSLLPQRPLLMDARPQAVAAPKLKVAAAPLPTRRQAAAAVAQKKGIQIEGQLKDRKVLSYSVPPAPSWAVDWARGRGILEADVAIRFTVDEAGNVLSDMRVENSSANSRLDQLAMDTLNGWRFAPNPGAGVQWGVITFRFELE